MLFRNESSTKTYMNIKCVHSEKKVIPLTFCCNYNNFF